MASPGGWVQASKALKVLRLSGIAHKGNLHFPRASEQIVQGKASRG